MFYNLNLDVILMQMWPFNDKNQIQVFIMIYRHFYFCVSACLEMTKFSHSQTKNDLTDPFLLSVLN